MGLCRYALSGSISDKKIKIYIRKGVPFRMDEIAESGGQKKLDFGGILCYPLKDNEE